MDLVASYDSEIDSDIEEIMSEVSHHRTKSAPKTVKKRVDIIDLDTESENESIGVEKNSAEMTKKPKTKTRKKSHQEIDCIDLEDNDCLVDTSKESSKTNEVSIPSKKIDYLNLEDSDSDMECENIDKNTLIENACTLNSIPCGPPKPSEESLQHFTESNFPEKESDNSVPVSNINTDFNCNSSRNTPDFVQSNISRDSTDCSSGKKRFHGESSVEINNFQNDVDDSETEKDISCIYREDERIIEASQKNIVCRIPRQITHKFIAHSNIVTSLNWCIPKFSYLFLSASHDGSIKIWDLFRRRNSIQCIKTIGGLNAAKWSLDGGQIVAGGLGEKAFVFDVQSGKNLVAYDIYNI